MVKTQDERQSLSTGGASAGGNLHNHDGDDTQNQYVYEAALAAHHFKEPDKE